MNETQATHQSRTKDKIINLLLSTKRKGMNAMIDYLVSEGFFESPASTKFHGSYPGGLAKHSLRVYELLIGYCLQIEPAVARASGQKPLELKPENIVIAGLLHDVCKIGAYVRTKADDGWTNMKGKDKGHATLSIERIKKLIELMPVEELIIRFHMGIYGAVEWESYCGEYRICGDHAQDEGMTKEQSQAARYGKSLRNAWYHNPVCKLMYFADELATLEEKAEE